MYLSTQWRNRLVNARAKPRSRYLPLAPNIRQAKTSVKYFGDEEKINYDNSTIEGGDVLVLGRGAVLIGMSERTTLV